MELLWEQFVKYVSFIVHKSVLRILQLLKITYNYLKCLSLLVWTKNGNRHMSRIRLLQGSCCLSGWPICSKCIVTYSLNDFK